MAVRKCRAVITSLWFLLSACRAESTLKGDAPPPAASPRAGGEPGISLCSGPSRAFGESELSEIFSLTVSGMCADPNGRGRAYGEGQSEPLDGVCVELFNGECELYKAFGLRRVATLRFVDGAGSPAAVTATLSRFSGSDGAYAFFTHRVASGMDPKVSTLRPLELEGEGALGTAVAYVWRAGQVLELAYTNENESPSAVRTSSDRLLPSFAVALASRLRGDLQKPDSVRLLPAESRLPLGVLYEMRNAFQVDGLGAGATGYYDDGVHRYRVFAAVHPDPQLARDMMRSLRRLPGLRTLKDSPYDAFELHGVMPGTAAAAHWLVGRNEQIVAAIGDEAYALTPESTLEQRAKASLSPDQKAQLLRKLLR